MVFPLLIPIALIASSAIMVAPYANEEIKKSQEAKKVIDMPAQMMDDYQSTKLKNYTNTDGLLHDNQVELPNSIFNQSWFIPAVFAGLALMGLMIIGGGKR